MKNIKLLELCVEYPHLINRLHVVDYFNKFSSLNIDNKQFFKLFMEYGFNDNDNLCVSLKALLDVANNQLDIMDLHFTYSIHGKGYYDAKNDFVNRVNHEELIKCT